MPVEQVLQKVGALVARVAPGHGRADGTHLGQSGPVSLQGLGGPGARGQGPGGRAGGLTTRLGSPRWPSTQCFTSSCWSRLRAPQ